MLSTLRVRGLALLEDVTLELSPGLNVLTGETGAGKSIIVEALTLLRGGRAQKGLVRAASDAATVDAVFELGARASARVEPLLERYGLPSASEDGLVVQRVVPRDSRGRAAVQRELAPLSVLVEIGAELVDVCSQHEHSSLTVPSRHGELLDEYAELSGDVANYAAAFDAYRAAQAELERVAAEGAALAGQAEFLRFQVEELERVAPRAGEYHELEARLAVLRDAHHWASFAAAAENVLSEAVYSVVSRLGRLAEQSRRGEGASPRLGELLSELETAMAACSAAARIAARFQDSLEVLPGELALAEERFFALTLLRRKHGLEPDELARRAATLRDQLDALESAGERRAALERRVAELHARASELAAGLSERRHASAKALSLAVTRELAELHLPFAQLATRVAPKDGGTLGPRGQDRVEFLFSANSGEPPQPLARVASGGELSRVLLALKSALGGTGSVATYVFDEVDAGVSGAAAEAIGRRLAKAAGAHQVVCVTHLPQIAAFAERHLVVEKATAHGRTTSTVRALSERESIEELARMLGGATITASAREHARALRGQARRARRAAPALSTCPPLRKRARMGRVA